MGIFKIKLLYLHPKLFNKVFFMITKELILDFIDRAYETSCKHGFHDVERSNEHWLMLVLSEVGEIVEADRKNRRANRIEFDAMQKYGHSFEQSFVKNIKDTVEDELADVCIRLFDFCGLRGVKPLMTKDGLVDMKDEFEKIMGKMSVCEQCFVLTKLIADMNTRENVERLEFALGHILSFCFEFARFHGIDLIWHVENKLRYNESRERLHGKKY